MNLPSHLKCFDNRDWRSNFHKVKYVTKTGSERLSLRYFPTASVAVETLCPPPPLSSFILLLAIRSLNKKLLTFILIYSI